MSSSRAKILKRKISNVKARRDVKRKRAVKMQGFHAFSPYKSGQSQYLISFLSNSSLSVKEKEEFVEFYRQLIDMRVDKLGACQFEDQGSTKRLHDYSLVLMQVYLHRAISLYEGAFQSLYMNNTYLMALSVRGLYESTAALGFLFSRVNACVQKNISATELDSILMTLFLGTKDKSILEDDKLGNYEAKNVMKLLDYADKIFTSEVMKKESPEPQMLRDSYEWLCEFCHPNFHSGTLSYRLDKTNQQLVFSHGKESVSEDELIVVRYALIAVFAFIAMYEQTKDLIEEYF